MFYRFSDSGKCRKQRILWKKCDTSEGEVPIQRDTEQGLMALIYGEDGLEAIPVKEMEQGNFREKNDYVYYLSFRFGK